MQLTQILNLVIEWSNRKDIDETKLDVSISPDYKEFKIKAR